MKGGFTTRRRAERFDALVSGDSAETDGRDAELVTLVSALRQAPPVEARPEFVSSLRERLVSEAAAMPAPDRTTVERLTLRHSTVRRERRIATALGGLAVASATTSMAVASQDALPGEALYPIKRAIESAESSLQSDDASRATTLLDHARQRLAEARELSADGPRRAEGAPVSGALDDFSSQANQGASLAISGYRETGDDEGLVALRTFAAASLAELDSLSDQVPRSARASLVGAVNTVQSIEDAVTRACPSCTGPTALTDPALIANLEDLLSAEPEALQSLALAAEDIAADVPTQPSEPTTSAGPSSGDDGVTSPDPTLAPGDLNTSLPGQLPGTEDGPIRTLLGEVEKDLEDTTKGTGTEDWTLLDEDGLTGSVTDGVTDGLDDTLGLSGD